MSWLNQQWVTADVESTGVSVFNDRIVTACVARVGGDQPTEVRTWLVNPNVAIPPEATAIHGVTDEQVATGMDAATAVDEVASALCEAWARGMPTVFFNASFDLSMLTAELDRYALASLPERLGRPIGPVFDPFVIWKHVERFRKGKRTLAAACEAFEVRNEGAHDSAQDALAAARVLWRICQRFPKVAAMSAPELHEAQVGWAAEQAAGLQEYFRRKDPNAVIDGSWPVAA